VCSIIIITNQKTSISIIGLLFHEYSCTSFHVLYSECKQIFALDQKLLKIKHSDSVLGPFK
jgi:hypothetical protein